MTRLLPLLALLALAGPAAAEMSQFAENETRAAAFKDDLRAIRLSLTDGNEGTRALASEVAAAFKGTDDWAAATESFFNRKADLLKRADALEARLTKIVASTGSENFKAVKKALDRLAEPLDVLRSDYSFFSRLPGLAAGRERAAAQAAMRMVGQTGDYPVALAFFISKTPGRAPFAPLPAGMMRIRHR